MALKDSMVYGKSGMISDVNPGTCGRIMGRRIIGLVEQGSGRLHGIS